MPAASVEYFAEDRIAFAPGAVNGKKVLGWAYRFSWHAHLAANIRFRRARR